MSRDSVGNCFSEDIRKRAARRPKDGLRFNPKRKISQWSPQKLDHEFAYSLRTRLAGDTPVTHPSRNATSKRRWKRLIGLPVEPVTQTIRITCFSGISRDPHRNDIIVNLIIGRDLDQLDRSLPKRL